jgi:hypothetical protein
MLQTIIISYLIWHDNWSVVLPVSAHLSPDFDSRVGHNEETFYEWRTVQKLFQSRAEVCETSFRGFNIKFVCISRTHGECYMPHPFHLPWFYHVRIFGTNYEAPHYWVSPLSSVKKYIEIVPDVRVVAKCHWGNLLFSEIANLGGKICRTI